MRQREWVNAEWSGFTATGRSAPGVAGDELAAFAAIMPESHDYLIIEHDPEKSEPVSRLREARFGGRRKVGKDHAQTKS